MGRVGEMMQPPCRRGWGEAPAVGGKTSATLSRCASWPAGAARFCQHGTALQHIAAQHPSSAGSHTSTAPTTAGLPPPCNSSSAAPAPRPPAAAAAALDAWAAFNAAAVAAAAQARAASADAAAAWHAWVTASGAPAVSGGACGCAAAPAASNDRCSAAAAAVAPAAAASKPASADGTADKVPAASAGASAPLALALSGLVLLRWVVPQRRKGTWMKWGGCVWLACSRRLAMEPLRVNVCACDFSCVDCVQCVYVDERMASQVRG